MMSIGLRNTLEPPKYGQFRCNSRVMAEKIECATIGGAHFLFCCEIEKFQTYVLYDPFRV